VGNRLSFRTLAPSFFSCHHPYSLYKMLVISYVSPTPSLLGASGSALVAPLPIQHGDGLAFPYRWGVWSRYGALDTGWDFNVNSGSSRTFS